MPRKFAPGSFPKTPEFSFYTLTDAARVFGCSPATVRNHFDAGRLSGVRASDGTRLIARDDVERKK
jgi:hypothetical protein